MAARAPLSDRVRATEAFGEARGFSLTELMIVVAGIAIVAAIAIPTMTEGLPNMRVGMSARAVERQLQTARLRAVSANRVMRVRFNCPGAGQFRMVELIGTPSAQTAADADTAGATRCSLANYPHPDQATGVFDIPNYDGPIVLLEPQVEFVGVQTIEFWPDGSAHLNTGAGGAWPTVPSNDPVEITLQRKDGTTAAKAASLRTIEVNSLGRIRLLD